MCCNIHNDLLIQIYVLTECSDLSKKVNHLMNILLYFSLNVCFSGYFGRGHFVDIVILFVQVRQWFEFLLCLML